MNKNKWIVLCLLSATASFMAGGYLFSETQRRSPFGLDRCRNCTRSSELAGLLASVGIQRLPAVLPGVIFETDKTIVITHPQPSSRVHYVIIPRKDIRSIGQISAGDDPYLRDVFACASRIIQEQKLTHYRLLTNGPGFQSVTYLHFHLISE